jgi:hypothetical protein
MAEAQGSKHLNYTIAFATLALVALKVLFVANFKLDVALGLLSAADPGRVVLALLMSLLPLVAVTALAVSGIGLGVALGMRRLRMSAALAVVIPLAIAASSAPLGTLIVGLLVSLGAVGLGWYLAKPAGLLDPDDVAMRLAFLDALTSTQRGRDDVAKGNVRLIAQLILVGLMALGTTADWMPIEKVTIDGKDIVGYVVNDDGRWGTILRLSDSNLVIAPSASITHRDVCGNASSCETFGIGAASHHGTP